MPTDVAYLLGEKIDVAKAKYNNHEMKNENVKS